MLAKASIQSENNPYIIRKMLHWILAFARMTVGPIRKAGQESITSSTP